MSSIQNIPSKICALCRKNRAQVIRPKNGERLCKLCFLTAFETEIHATIVENNLFPQRGERIAVGASGGKDSTVLASVLKSLNEKYDYGVEFILLSIDEGIHGYRDDSLETVKRNAVQYGMQLTIVGYDSLYGWTMDQVVEQVGKKGNCTYCGVFRRQALDRGAKTLGITHVLTGHNADDIAETVLMNLLRGDLPRLGRCTEIITASSTSKMRRSKPLKYAYEKEIVLYAHYNKLDYFSTECIYSPEAFRGSARSLLKALEKVRPSSILDIVRSGEQLAQFVNTGPSLEFRHDKEDITPCKGNTNTPGRPQETSVLFENGYRPFISEAIDTKSTPVKINNDSQPIPEKSQNKYNSQHPNNRKTQLIGYCQQCGYMSSQAICKACTLVESLNKGRASIQINEGSKKSHCDVKD